jgi:hypothetical protein
LGRTCSEESTLLQAASKRSGAASGGGRNWSGCRTADRPSRPRGRVCCWSLLHAPTRQISSASWRAANQSLPMPSTVRTTAVGKIAKLMPRTRRRLSGRASPARSQAERPRPATGRGAPPGRADGFRGRRLQYQQLQEIVHEAKSVGLPQPSAQSQLGAVGLSYSGVLLRCRARCAASSHLPVGQGAGIR